MKPHEHLKKRNNSGFTLVELVAALAILSIIVGMAFTSYAFTRKYINGREKAALGFESEQALLNAVSENIAKSKTTIMLSTNHWQFIKENNDTCTYDFINGTVMYNQNPVPFTDASIKDFSFTCFGNDSLLDANNDREVSFNELDLNSDNQINENETAGISRIRVTVNLKDDKDFALYCERAVRCH